MDWTQQSTDWPHAGSSRFILCKPHYWHLQEMGSGPLLLLIHGAGGATQSWRHLMPLLAEHYRIVALDLPGQGYTKLGAQQRAGLTPMAQDIAALCTAEGWHPDAIVGHSAGAAIALEMARAGHFDGPIIGINAALGNFTGFAGVVFPLMAKALAMTPMIAQIFTASTSRPKSVTRLIEGTGSKLSEADQRWYRALVSDRGHVNATLAMMAQWDLNPLLRDLPKHALPVLLITGDQDKAVPPTTSQNLVAKMPNAAHVSLPGLGHLAHEEDAKAILTPILQFLDTEIGQISDIN
jgi:magnesium chelatase accessory protein